MLKRESQILQKVFVDDTRILTKPEELELADLVITILAVPRLKLCYREKLTPHGEKIANYMSEHNMMVDFIKLWRQHFLDTMKPTKMPFLWVDSPGVYEKFQIQHPSVVYA